MGQERLPLGPRLVHISLNRWYTLESEQRTRWILGVTGSRESSSGTASPSKGPWGPCQSPIPCSQEPSGSFPQGTSEGIDPDAYCFKHLITPFFHRLTSAKMTSVTCPRKAAGMTCVVLRFDSPAAATKRPAMHNTTRWVWTSHRLWGLVECQTSFTDKRCASVGQEPPASPPLSFVLSAARLLLPPLPRRAILENIGFDSPIGVELKGRF